MKLLRQCGEASAMRFAGRLFSYVWFASQRAGGDLGLEQT